ncbi:MAG: hypothetical protein ACREHG_03460, partial [Candidatus Saccharimonadales bacterium]
DPDYSEVRDHELNPDGSATQEYLANKEEYRVNTLSVTPEQVEKGRQADVYKNNYINASKLVLKVPFSSEEPRKDKNDKTNSVERVTDGPQPPAAG